MCFWFETYFIVESYEEVTGFLSRWRHIKNLTRNGLYTGNFCAMNTGIPHKELFTAIDQATRESFDWAADKYSIPTDQICIKWTGSSCMWVRSRHSDHSKSSHTFTQKQLNTLVRWLVSNTFLLAGKSTHTGKPLVFRWERTVLLHLQICICITMNRRTFRG